ncbi:SufE family protein [Alkalimonas collagenimarina]|uniref:SufE family protein n=1 Tax=Alkalimonas collagenimarina TaxID=400390 RepID=A0ABT9H0X2_9GAMM|nr:SufE family protein [Alkalimonas collagenimarina]MDP4536940.1 SufE family protein [Alkalimonas collagenimarina]
MSFMNDCIAETAQALEHIRQDLLPELANPGHWQERYRALMGLARQLPTLPEERRPSSALIEGCESRAWLLHYFDSVEDKHYFVFESDARIVKALLAVLLCQINGMDNKTFKACQLELCLKELHLTQHLSQSRSKGLSSVIKHLQQLQASS